MSVQSAIKRKTAPDIRARKNGEPIVMLTSYHAHTAALVDRHCGRHSGRRFPRECDAWFRDHGAGDARNMSMA